MRYAPLATVQHRLKVGEPVPFNIHHADFRLLLARGQPLLSASQLEALLEREAVVDNDDLKSPSTEAYEAPPEELPALWAWNIGRMAAVLRHPDRAGFPAVLDEVMAPLLALIERDADVAIFQLVRPSAAAEVGYGMAHAVHVGVGAWLVGRRLGWDAAALRRVFKAALTMNLSVLDLQSRLALQPTPVTVAQREALRTHATRSVELLQAAGVDDADWLGAVRLHHDKPRDPADLRDMAALLRCVDIYTAKLSARVTRRALPANRALRDLFVQDGQSSIAAAVVKEFGMFPPGCFITLQSGETGVVIKRGSHPQQPVVASLLGRQGDALLEPVRRATDAKEHAIVNVVPESSLKVRVSPAKLAAMAAR